MQARSASHCFAHHIPDIIVGKQEYGYIVTNEERAQSLNYLRENNADLVRGDLIVYDSMAGYRNEGVEIFDGEKIIPLDNHLDDYGSLPKQFHVIVNNVPIKYWNDNHDNVIGVDHNNIVWFNHSLVRHECLQNIKYELINGKWTIYTTFIFNNIQYRIILADYVDDNEFDDYNDENYELGSAIDINNCIQRFKNLLQQEGLIFESWSEFFDKDDHTLFITGSWTDPNDKDYHQ